MKRSTSWLVALAFLNLSLLGLVAARLQNADDEWPEGNRQTSSRGSSVTESGSTRREFSVSGPLGTHPNFKVTVNPENELKVRIEAGAGHILRDPEIWNLSSPYHCVSFSVSALGKTIKTKVLRVSGDEAQAGPSPCASAEHFEVVDFSSLIPAHHGPIDVEIAAEGYDYPLRGMRGDPLVGVDKTHALDGTIEFVDSL